ncbi:MAG: hypothetical protein ACN6RL_04395 [Variovorax sp.]
MKGDYNFAGGYASGYGSTGSRNVAIGYFANVDEATAAGVTANDVVAIGSRALAGKDSAIAIGTSAKATGLQSISIGTGNVVGGDHSGAIGDPSIINGANSYSVGNNNTIGATTSDAFVLGNNVHLGADAAGATTASVSGAVALGSDTSVTQPGGVALGQGSVASTAAGIAPYVPPSAAAAQASAITSTTGTLAAVSVGDAANGKFRQITGVAAGAADSDAVNVSQLKAVSSAAAAGAVHYYSVNDGGTQQGNYSNGGATGLNSLAAGVNATAEAANSVSMGNGASVGAIATGGIAIGTGASVSGTVSTGATTPSTFYSSIAIGNNAKSHDAQEVVIGTNAGLNATMLAQPGYLSDSVMVGAQAGTNSKYQYATFIGQEAGRNTNGAHNTAVGQNAMRFMDGSANTALGSNALASANASGLNPASGSSNTGIGSGAGVSLQGSGNAYLGASAGAGTIGSNNVASGNSAGASVEGSGNVASGYVAGNNVTGSNNVASGFLTGINVTGDYNIASGFMAGTGITANDTVAIGSQARASQNSAIAIGNGARANGLQSISIGTGNQVNGAHSGAIGDPSYIDADDSYAIGNNNTIAVGANQSFVLGNNVTVANANNVVLGNGSADKAAVQVSSATVPGVIATLNPDGSVSYAPGPSITYGNFAGTAAGVVSVGAPGAERQIVNVAPGEISSTSTDAINGSQLYAVASTVNALGGSITTIVNNAQTHYYSVNDGGTRQGNYDNSGASAANSIAVGAGASVGSGAVNSLAVGTNASATTANSVAVGPNATASTDNSVALGAGSTTAAATPTASTTIQGQTYDFAGAAPVGVVSVGAPGAERQIQNVAAGQISATSTDAINGSQLYATNQAINNIQVGGAGIKYFHANSQAADSQAAGAESVAIGPQAIALGNSAFAGGSGAQANGASSIALGANAIATTSSGVALGSGASADRAGMNGQREMFSNVSVLSAQGAVSVGSAGNERQITNVAGGTQATDAVNVRQLQAVQAGSVRYDTNVDGSVNYNSVTMGNGSAAGPVAVHNVAPGVAPTDAVNVQQLNQSSAANTAYTDARVNALGSEIRGVARNAYAGVAAAMAVQMPGTYVPGKTVMRIGYGVFKGESAVGVSFRRTSENNAWSLTGGVGMSRAGAAATVGAEWVFN